MSAAIAEPAGGAVAVRSGKKKKLLVILVAVALLLCGLGGGAVFYLKKKQAAAAAAAAEAEDGEGDEKAAEKHARQEHLVPPTYLPLEPFVVNLADRDSDRYAQIGIILEVQDAAFAERMKAYMPAVRDAILMTITRKSSRELLEPNGKEQLAAEIKREAVRPLGIVIPAPKAVTEAPASGVAAAGDDDERPKKKRKAEVKNPVQQVNFSSFIIQ